VKGRASLPDANLSDMSLGAEELNGVETSELAVAEYGQERELDGDKTACVIWSDSETVINPLPGDD
jgi:hypothetical protein